jgi:hypothetical protein
LALVTKRHSGLHKADKKRYSRTGTERGCPKPLAKLFGLVDGTMLVVLLEAPVAVYRCLFK